MNVLLYPKDTNLPSKLLPLLIFRDKPVIIGSLGMLALVHVPQLVSNDGGASNDSNLSDNSNDGGSVTNHGSTLQSAEDCTKTES